MLRHYFQFSPDHIEMKVVYWEEHLHQFSPPKVWTASLGWKPENETSIKMKKLNRSAAEESRRFRTSLSLVENPSNLSILVQEEKSQSDAFEDTLKQVIFLLFYKYFNMPPSHRGSTLYFYTYF